MLGRLCKARLRKEGATYLLMEKLEISTSVRQECLPRKFMKTSYLNSFDCLFWKKETSVLVAHENSPLYLVNGCSIWF